MENGEVDWLLSINSEKLPTETKQAGKRTYRSLIIGGEEFEFSEGFNDLHTVSYQKIMEGEGFPLSETRNTIQMVHDIRNAKTV